MNQDDDDSIQLYREKYVRDSVHKQADDKKRRSEMLQVNRRRLERTKLVVGVESVPDKISTDSVEKLHKNDSSNESTESISEELLRNSNVKFAKHKRSTESIPKEVATKCNGKFHRKYSSTKSIPKVVLTKSKGKCPRNNSLTESIPKGVTAKPDGNFHISSTNKSAATANSNRNIQTSQSSSQPSQSSAKSEVRKIMKRNSDQANSFAFDTKYNVASDKNKFSNNASSSTKNSSPRTLQGTSNKKLFTKEEASFQSFLQSANREDSKPATKKSHRKSTFFDDLLEYDVKFTFDDSAVPSVDKLNAKFLLEAFQTGSYV